MSALERAPVEDEYRHDSKVACAEAAITLGSATLKWYEIAPAGDPVPLVVRALARRCLRDAAKRRALRLEGELGFVILHRCGEDFYFLLVTSWQNENELWETVFAKDGSNPFFRPWIVQGTHRPTFCVWELGAVCHERLAWSEYLRSPRDEAARRAYLASTYEGEV